MPKPSCAKARPKNRGSTLTFDSNLTVPSRAEWTRFFLFFLFLMKASCKLPFKGSSNFFRVEKGSSIFFWVDPLAIQANSGWAQHPKMGLGLSYLILPARPARAFWGSSHGRLRAYEPICHPYIHCTTSIGNFWLSMHVPYGSSPSYEPTEVSKHKDKKSK